ncbi:MAG: hypothetical protein M1820_009612 [Bogoriella megaspora]|nr:MAG: hypothetical protein M1820_009612 [Bogoriella megaspora]
MSHLPTSSRGTSTPIASAFSPSALLKRTSRVETRTLALGSLAAWAVLAILFLYNYPPSWDSISSLRSDPLDGVPRSRRGAGPFPIPITSQVASFPTEDQFGLPYPSLYPKPLGKDVLILDVDSRRFDQEGELMNESPLDWQNSKWATAGRLGHYFYALLHGYDYKFVQAAPTTDRHGTWAKVAEIRSALKRDYRFIIFLDADVLFSQPEIPLEYLFNYWNITSEISVAMANDFGPPTFDTQEGQIRRNSTNTGFGIFQNNPTTKEILKRWEECTSEVIYKGCARWLEDFAHEQSAFSQYLRYDFEDQILALPCQEANGFPALKGGCEGKYVRHLWTKKKEMAQQLEHTILQSIMGPLHARFLRDRKNNIWDHSDNSPWGGEESHGVQEKR